MIEKPEVVSTITGYIFTWPGERIVIEVSRIHIHKSDAKVTGEITVKTQDEEDEMIIISPPTSFNFTSDRTRKELANSMSKKIESLPWTTIIDQLCYGVQDRARKGEPVQELWTDEEIPELEFLLKPILIKGVPSVIFGEKGVAKSTLSLYIYYCLMLPWADNPLGLTVPAESVRTLILDYEVPGYIALLNIQKMKHGMGLPDIPLYHRRCILPLADDLEQIANRVSEVKAEVLIIDSLARASGGDLNKTEGANNFFEALDKLGKTSLIIAQTSKDTETKKKSIYGNALFTYYARSIFELCKSDYSEEDTIDVALFHRWANLTKRYPDMGFRINFNGHKTILESQPLSISEFMAKVTDQRKITHELRMGSLTAKEITENIDGNLGSVKVLLSKLKKKGIVVNLEGGRWGLHQTS